MAITLTAQVGVRSSGTTILLPYAAPNAAGALLTLVTGAGSSAAPLSVTDSAGNTWALASQLLAGSSIAGTVWYAANAIASTNTLTVANSLVANSMQCEAHEWAGVSTATPLLASTTHATTAAASTHTAGSVSPAPSSALVLITYTFASGHTISTPPTGYTQINSTFNNMHSYFKALSGSTSTENPEAITSANLGSANVIAAFSGVGGAAAGGAPRRFRMALLGVS